MKSCTFLGHGNTSEDADCDSLRNVVITLIL